MPRTLTRVSAALLIAVLPVLAMACGSDDEAADTTTTTEPPPPCSEVYVAGTGAPEGPESIESRGDPEMEACTPDGQLEIIDDVVGTGAEAVSTSTVTAQYSGAVAATGEVFHSSWQMDGAIDFPLNQVIPGWTEGMTGMKVGGRRTLVIPADLAYGANPPQGSGIPANADLVFTIDLVAVS
ncbi:hypothetical protein BH10ACT3_BH10ACT3_17700 [soil metagenome]